MVEECSERVRQVSEMKLSFREPLQQKFVGAYSIGRPITAGAVINDKYCPGRGFYGRQLGKSPSGRIFGLCEIAGIGSPPP